MEPNNPPPRPEPSLGKILFADDDELFRLSLGKLLKKAGYECDFAISAAEAIMCLRKNE